MPKFNALIALPILALDYDTIEDIMDSLPAVGGDEEWAGQIAEARLQLQMALEVIDENGPDNEDDHRDLEEQDAELAARLASRG